jgi:hypothetical protein
MRVLRFLHFNSSHMEQTHHTIKDDTVPNVPFQHTEEMEGKLHALQTLRADLWFRCNCTYLRMFLVWTSVKFLSICCIGLPLDWFKYLLLADDLCSSVRKMVLIFASNRSSICFICFFTKGLKARLKQIKLQSCYGSISQTLVPDSQGYQNNLLGDRKSLKIIPISKNYLVLVLFLFLSTTCFEPASGSYLGGIYP